MDTLERVEGILHDKILEWVKKGKIYITPNGSPICSHDIKIAAKAAIEAMQGWRKIETAPKDGTEILLYDRNRKNRYIGYWEIQEHNTRPQPYWHNCCTYRDIMYQRTYPPTHWQPLPTPPEEK